MRTLQVDEDRRSKIVGAFKKGLNDALDDREFDPESEDEQIVHVYSLGYEFGMGLILRRRY